MLTRLTRTKRKEAWNKTEEKQGLTHTNTHAWKKTENKITGFN